MLKKVFIFSCFLISITVKAQDITPTVPIISGNDTIVSHRIDDTLQTGTETIAAVDSNKKKTLKILPLAYFTPETSIAGELVAYYSFFTPNANRRSNVRFFATYTQNKQFFLILPWQVYTANEKYFLTGSIDYKLFFPEYFYGLGNNTKADARQLYNLEGVTFDSKNYASLGKHLFVGLGLQYQHIKAELPHIHQFNHGNGRECNIIGGNGYDFAGFGANLMYDTRDHILCPRKGEFLEISNLFATGMTDETPISFAQINFDYRNYTPVGKNGVWANQFLAQFSMGYVPYRALPSLGGAYVHRGYYAGRFRDYNLLLYQTEYRQHIYGRFGAVAFGSVGRVFENLTKPFDLREFSPAAGVGLRFQISKNDRSNVRLDYSVGKDSHGIYVYFAEAF